MDAPRVLIIDDDPYARQALEYLLFVEGYALRSVSNAADAFTHLSDWRPDVILCDVMMPEMDGMEFCRRVRTDPEFGQVPILLLTALDDRESKIAGLEAGADEFLSKPYDTLELRARLRTITRLNRQRHMQDQHLQLLLAHQELLNAYDATIEGWSHALDLRDKETEGHTQRVTTMTLQLARASGITDYKALQNIRWGALLHDIGKLGVPDYILLKPGKLTADEWMHMRRHPDYAYEMLKPIHFLGQALDIPYCHHERWDGTGYPRGLKRSEIPLNARLFAVTDIWDAITSDRPYRPAMPEAQALDYLASLRGSHLEPEVVDLFFDELAASVAVPEPASALMPKMYLAA